MIKNKLPYSNQFERGHSFNWAGKWKKGTYYLNDEYVTDFVVCSGMLLACRTNHQSSEENEPIPIIENSKIIGIESIYWSFIADISKVAYVPNYDSESGNITWIRTVIENSVPEVVNPLDISSAIEGKIKVKEHCFLNEEQYDELIDSGTVDDNILYFIFEND